MQTMTRRKKTLSLETLETRLNLSTAVRPFANWSHLGTSRLSQEAYRETLPQPNRIVVDLSPVKVSETIAPEFEELVLGDTTVNGSANVAINDYSSISNWKLETRSSGQNLGYMSTSGAYVDYKLNVATAGNYDIRLSTASLSNGYADLYVNGAKKASYTLGSTGSWDSYRQTTASTYLNAGLSTIRIQSTGGSQFNLNGVAISQQGTSTGSTTNVGSNTNVPIAQYSAIYNSKLETRSSGQNIGYVSTAGAYVEYKLNAASAGTYNLNVGFATPGGASADVYINGAKQKSFSIGATGSWDSYKTHTAQISLAAGANTLRIHSTNGTQYNLNAINLATASTTVAPTPTPTTPTTPSGSPISVNTKWMTSFNQLNITGTSGNDSIYVSQSGNTIYVSANGQNTSYSGPFGNIVIKGVSGGDNITVDSSVTMDTLVYSGVNSSSTIKNFTKGRATIVALGNGYDNVQGNGVNTSYWVDTSDGVNASSSEWNAGRVHQVGSFYGGVSTQLSGQNLSDPSGTGSTTRLNSNSLWGTGPTVYDVNQGQLSNCYLLGPLQSLAFSQPERLREVAVDLGDGTYAVQFVRNGSKQFVRVDGDLPAGGPYGGGLMYAHPGSSGNLWMPIIEKAYAVFRTGASSYSSLNNGMNSSTFNDVGVSNSGFSIANVAASTVFSNITNALSAGKAVVVGSTSSPGAPISGLHSYSVTGASKDAWGNMNVTVRNPWGFDGASWDGNGSDGFLTLNMSTFQKAFGSGSMTV